MTGRARVENQGCSLCIWIHKLPISFPGPGPAASLRERPQGGRGLLVRDEEGVERAFGSAEPASYYNRVMTKGWWMPLLVGERI